MNIVCSIAVAAWLALGLSVSSEAVKPLPSVESELDCGPFLGHVTPTKALVWARCKKAGSYRLEISDSKIAAEATAREAHDFCVVWKLEGLQPGRRYAYTIRDSKGARIAGGEGIHLSTAKIDSSDDDLRIFFGSCAKEDEATRETWRQIAKQDIDVCVLLGDTPYIDSSKLDVQRKRYRAFARVPEMAKIFRTTSWYGTWDDHDFGLGDGDGRLKGKERSRRAFCEYHANPSYGEDEKGVYFKFRRGPVETFVLDTRYFAATEPSPFKKHHASLLGDAQWRWLLKGLKESTAPVKILACGMIWNGATRPKKEDHWGNYLHERQFLFEFIGEHKIEGVLLVSGDIHRSRVLRYDTEESAGYDIYELISSPMHSSVIAAANAPHPGLIKDMGEPQTFLLLEATQRKRKVTKLQARFLNAAGKEHFRIDVTPR